MLSGVAILAEAVGLAMMIVAKVRYTGLETFGPLITGLVGAGLTVASAIAGLAIASIGLKRSKDRQVRAPFLTIAVVVHAAVFVLFVLLIAY